MAKLLSLKTRQKGIATLLILMLVGIAVTIAVIGAVRFTQGAQNQTMAFHAQTQAQIKAWQGVDIVLEYLKELAANNLLEALMDEVPDVENEPPLSAQIDDTNLEVNFYKEEVSGVFHLYAQITGKSATGTRAASTSTIEAVYQIEPGSNISPPSCQLSTSTIFRGDLSITGGPSAFMSGDNLTDIAVEGNLTLGSASQAGLSGCATGNVNMTGGGIKDDGIFYVGGNFTVASMSPPKKASVWAKNIDIGNTGQGEYTALKAGAYRADVFDGQSSKVGTAAVGGRLIASTAGGSIPWQTGTILPFTDHNFIVELTDGTQALLKLGSASIDSNTGVVTGHTHEILSGEASLPDTLKFVATGIDGGNLGIHVLTVGQMWGHAVSIKGYSGKYNEILSNGNFDVVTGEIGKLTGGGNFHATSGGCSSSTNCWNYPTIASPSAIAGTVKIGSYTGTPVLNNFNLTPGVSGTSPGLPGAPFCDTRTDEINASDFKNQANYIFEYVGNTPQLTIQKVELSNGTKLDGVYNLSSQDVRKLHGKDFLACGWGSNHCFRDGSRWNLNGIYAFPPGVAWFDGPVTIDGVGDNKAVNGMASNNDILATIISAGTVTLTQSGHGKLVAPNFNATSLCQGDLRPTNLCNSSGQLVTWTDSDNSINNGLPLANVAILAQGELDIRGWTVDGHVIVGQGVKTSANQGIINGGLVVGANVAEGMAIGQGGLIVDTRNLSSHQRQTLCGTGESGVGEGGSGGWKVKDDAPLWTRYL